MNGEWTTVQQKEKKEKKEKTQTNTTAKCVFEVSMCEVSKKTNSTGERLRF